MIIDGIQIGGSERRGRREEKHFIGTALAIGLGVASAAGAIGSAAIGAHAAGSAADAQVNAANHAADIQHQDAQDALAFQKQTYADQQKNLSPWLQTGSSAAVNLANLLGVLPKDATIPGTGTPGTPGTAATPGYWDNSNTQDRPSGPHLGSWELGTGQGEWMPGSEATPGTPGTGATQLSSLVNPNLGAAGSLAQGWTGGAFKAPTDVTEQNDPGYQFRLQQGQQALERSAAARGNLLSGGTGKELQRYGQDYASNEYGNVYNRALGEYQQSYNQFQQGAADKYNRLANMAGMGQITAQQLSSGGQAAANNYGNILLTSGQQIGQNINNAGAARASGYVGGANAYGSAINSIGNLGSTLSLLSLLKHNNPSTTGDLTGVA